MLVNKLNWFINSFLLLPVLDWQMRVWCERAGVVSQPKKSILIYLSISLLIALFCPDSLNLETIILSSVFTSMLIIIGMIDYRTGYIPNVLSYPLFGLGLIVNLFAWPMPSQYHLGLESLYASAFAFLFVYGMNAIYHRITGMNGIGMGDVKLFAGLGALFGFLGIILILLIASAGSLIAPIYRKMKQIESPSTSPFGPYIAMAGVISMLVFCSATAQYYLFRLFLF